MLVGVVTVLVGVVTVLVGVVAVLVGAVLAESVAAEESALA